MSVQVETITGYLNNMEDFEDKLNDFINSYSVMFPIEYKTIVRGNDIPQIMAIINYETNNDEWQDIFNQVKDYDYNELLTAVLKLSNMNLSICFFVTLGGLYVFKNTWTYTGTRSLVC